MPLKVYNPTTPGRRKTSIVTTFDLTKEKPFKKLTESRKNHAGRNSQGKITIRHRGGGEKRRVRVIDFLRNRFGKMAKVASLEYDPNRGARIALIQYQDGMYSYIIAPDGLRVNDEIIATSEKGDIRVGNRMPLEFIPVGIIIHNIEMAPGEGGKLVRGAGTGAQIMAVEGPYAQVKMPSTEIRLLRKECLATIGQVSNIDHRLTRIGKAGRTRHKGIRPTVRGKVMNPVDHPHGGGEGKNSIGLKHPKTPWGKPALGVKTRRKKWSDALILSRRKTKKRKK